MVFASPARSRICFLLSALWFPSLFLGAPSTSSSTMKVSTTIDDVSPLIQYSGSWRAGSKSDDPFFNKYSDDGTFTLTQSNDASATIQFFGESITVYGAKRGNHDKFTTELDGGPKVVGEGRSATETFQQVLFASPVLQNKMHTLVIRDASINADAQQSYFDIDFIKVDSEVVGAQQVTIEDTDPTAWQWGPSPSDWNTTPQQLATFSQGSGHSTSKAQATALLSFTGSAVDVYGLVCSTCGAYWVSVDGGQPTSLTSFNSAWTKAGALLYTARGLTDGPHNLTFTNLATNTANSLALDYAVVYGANPGVANSHTGGSGGNGKADGQNAGTPKDNAAHGAPVGAIAGGVVGGLVIMLAGICFIIFWMRRRRKQEETDATTVPTQNRQLMSQSWQTPGQFETQAGVPYPMPPSNGAPSVYGHSTYNSHTSPYPVAGAAGVGWGGGQYQQPPPPHAYYAQGPEYGMHGHPQQPLYAHPGSAGARSQHSGSLPYMHGGARSDASGPSAGRPMSLSDFSTDTPPDYNAATLNGTDVPPVPLRRKN